MDLQFCLLRLRRDATVGDGDSIRLGEQWITQYLEAAASKLKALEALRDALENEPDPLRSQSFWVTMVDYVNLRISGLITNSLHELARILALLQTPSEVKAKEWAANTQRLIGGGQPDGAAAIRAASITFPAEFVATKFDHTKTGSIKDLLDAIEKL
jgi:hypothetical protein